eukprot:6199429-Pleurochrysis_carterae.AAC.4
MHACRTLEAGSGQHVPARRRRAGSEHWAAARRHPGLVLAVVLPSAQVRARLAQTSRVHAALSLRRESCMHTTSLGCATRAHPQVNLQDLPARLLVSAHERQPDVPLRCSVRRPAH